MTDLRQGVTEAAHAVLDRLDSAEPAAELDEILAAGVERTPEYLIELAAAAISALEDVFPCGS